MGEQMADVIVIGAGAAGLAAARGLRAAGAQVRLVEARDRVGGRVFQDGRFAERPIELGAELVHGERAATVELARRAGLALAPVDRYGGLRWSDGGPALPLPRLPDERRALIERLRAEPGRLAAGGLPDADASLADALRAAGYDERALELADVLLAQTCCAPLGSLSLADMAREIGADRAGPAEFRLREGYGPLFAWLAAGLDIVSGAPVSLLRWGPAGVAALTPLGELRARRCIITAPVAVLQAGGIAFDPPLPAAKRRAIEAFRTEPATKIFLRFDAPLWDPGLAYMAHGGLLARWWTPEQHHPGSPLICAYVTAGRARRADALDDAALRQVALAELAGLLGVPEPELAARCQGMRRYPWAADPYALGGYAHLPPGLAAARPALAQAVTGVLFFAGEATAYDSNPQTVHGAYESGERAAAECLLTL